MPDLTITCADCKQQFVWTVGEQAFYKEKNLPPPTLCLICRAKRRAEDADKARGKRLFG